VEGPSAFSGTKRIGIFAAGAAALSTLDKDRLSFVLASQKRREAAVARSPAAAVPMRLDAKEEAADLSRLPIYGG
jgi:hypothetical protein